MRRVIRDRALFSRRCIFCRYSKLAPTLESINTTRLSKQLRNARIDNRANFNGEAEVLVTVVVISPVLKPHAATGHHDAVQGHRSVQEVVGRVLLLTTKPLCDRLDVNMNTRTVLALPTRVIGCWQYTSK